MRRTISVGLLTAALAFGTTGEALAASAYPTSLSISYSRSSGGYFSGTLRSHGGCVDGRKVTVYKQSPGNDPAVGTATTPPNGKWRVSGGKVSAGDYYAKTPATARSGAGGGRCGPAKSPVTHVS